MRKLALAALSAFMPSMLAFGAGYQLNLQGLRQLAMGGGGTAVPWDASTIFYNPGGLSRLDHFQVYGAGLFLIPTTQYINNAQNYSTYTQKKTFTPFNFYAGGTLKSMPKLGFGLGVYTPFGSGTFWEDNWTGRYIIQNIELQTIFIQPTVSYRINDAISVGVGYIYATGNVDIARALPLQNSAGADGQAKLDGNATGMGYNIGISVKASEKLNFGITYRSRVDMHVKDGDAKFTVPTSVASNFQNTKFDATVPCPEVLSLGVGWKAMDKLTLTLDLNFTGWKAFDSLAFNYSTPVNGTMRTSDARLYKSRMATRIGAHYQATDRLEIMAGGAYDPSPVRDGYVTPDLPDANRIVLTTGFVYKPIPKLGIMAVVEYVTSERRDGSYDDAGFSGTYQTHAITPGIGITYDIQ
jgi:long-chain fatty acid transport protein